MFLQKRVALGTVWALATARSEVLRFAVSLRDLLDKYSCSVGGRLSVSIGLHMCVLRAWDRQDHDHNLLRTASGSSIPWEFVTFGLGETDMVGGTAHT